MEINDKSLTTVNSLNKVMLTKSQAIRDNANKIDFHFRKKEKKSDKQKFDLIFKLLSFQSHYTN